MIQRPDYINRLLKFKDTNIIKILVGVRRCGKSTVLDMYKDVLIDEYNISKENIVQKDIKLWNFLMIMMQMICIKILKKYKW